MTDAHKEESIVVADISTVEGCRELAREVTEAEEGDAMNAATLMLLSASVGPDVEKLAALTGIDPAFVRTVGARLAYNKIWTSDGKVCCNWADEELGTIEFLCDVNVALGFMERES